MEKGGRRGGQHASPSPVSGVERSEVGIGLGYLAVGR